MPKIVDHDRTRTRIREAARAVYAERGLARTGLVHVARHAGMGRATLYHYYPTREVLLAEVAEDLLREEIAMFAHAAETRTDPVDAIAGVAETVTQLYGDWIGEGRMLLQLWAQHPERFRTALVSIREGIAGLIVRGQRERSIDQTLDPMATATIVAGIVDGVLLQYFLDPETCRGDGSVSATVRVAVTKVLRP